MPEKLSTNHDLQSEGEPETGFEPEARTRPPSGWVSNLKPLCRRDLELLLHVHPDWTLFALYVLSVWSLCVVSLYAFSVISVCSLCMFTPFSLYALSVYSLCMFSLFSLCSLCMFSLCVLSVLSVCSLCMFSICVLSVLSVCSLCVHYLPFPSNRSMQVPALSAQYKTYSTTYEAGYSSSDSYMCLSFYRFFRKKQTPKRVTTVPQHVRLGIVTVTRIRVCDLTDFSVKQTPKRVKTGPERVRLGIVIVTRIRVCDLTDFSVKQTPQRVRLHGYCNSDSISTCL